MTRKDEIIEAAIQQNRRFAERRVGFINGACWADENPRKGLTDINKACEWLSENTYSIFFKPCTLNEAVNEFVDNFKKAMEK